MSTRDIKSFISGVHPFETLDRVQLDQVVNAMDIAYFKKGEVVASPTEKVEYLYVVLKGLVYERNDEEVLHVYQSEDSFDAQALLRGNYEHRYEVAEELLCYILPKNIFLELTSENNAFKSYYLDDLANKIRTIKEKQNTSALTSFMMARIKGLYLHKAAVVKESTMIIDALKLQESEKCSAIIVEFADDSLGIVTDSDLRKKVLLRGISVVDTIGKIATVPVIKIDANDFLFNALILMTKHSIKRLIVLEKEKVLGVLEQIDLLSYFSNHSYLLSVKIDRAQDLDALKNVSEKFSNVVSALHAKGVKARYIAKIVSELNIKIYQKVFELMMPKEFHDKTTLLLLGSEGRKEQIIKTDQDNALILSEDVDEDAIAQYAKKYVDALEFLGFPRCEGNVMIDNPKWRKRLEDFKVQIDSWFEKLGSQDFIDMATFYDAIAITGNRELFDELKAYLFMRMSNHPTSLALFASPVEQFETPLNIFSSFKTESRHNDELDLKKGGVFAIIHGIRALSFEQHLEQTNTIERIKALNDKEVISREMATELIESLDFFWQILLKSKLQKILKVQEPDNYIQPEKLSKLERDMLKDSFKIVQKFKKFLTYHFKLQMVR